MSLDDLQAQLRGALDEQFAALKQQYEEGISAARRDADAEAERRLAGQLEEAQAAFAARLEQEVGAARADAERRVAEAQQRTAEAQHRIHEAEQHAQYLRQQIDAHNHREAQA